MISICLCNFTKSFTKFTKSFIPFDDATISCGSGEGEGDKTIIVSILTADCIWNQYIDKHFL